MKIINKLAVITEQESINYLTNYFVSYIEDINVNEKNVDSHVHSILKNKLSYTSKEAELAVTKLRNSEIKIPSKTKLASGTGEIDCGIFINDKLKIIIEDKEPKESVELALSEAIIYANGLNAKGEDIRIVIGFTGIDILLRVLDHTSNRWVPFYINGQELKAFPGKYILNIIYSQKDIHGFVVENIKEDINIRDIIYSLKNIYRTTDLQNDNQKTIDFTIAFIGLKSILEKYKNQGIRGLKNWNSLNNKNNPKDNNSEDDEDLRDNLTSTIDKIFEKMLTKDISEDYTDLFIIKDSENTETFNFKRTLETFQTDYHLLSLRKIYTEITKLHDLHDSKIDLFGEVYESLGEKDFRKSFGQFFTRRHIIKTLIELMEINAYDFIGELYEEVENKQVVYKAKSPKNICDPACGTGGFLTEFFKYIKDEAQKHKNYKTIDLSKLASSSFYGYDIYTANVTRTKINMYLSGDGFSEIRKADTLQDQNINNNKFNYIITNPPYGKGTYTVNYSFQEGTETVIKPVINNQRLEVNFLVKIVDMLLPKGRAMAIIPDGILEATTLSPLRVWLLKYCKIEKIVSLPKHAFAPYTHEKTYAIFFEKRLIPLKDINQIENDPDIWSYIVDNDGFANSDKRFRTDRMDENGKYLHDEFSQWRGIDGSTNDSLIIERYKRKTQLKGEEFYNEWEEKIEGLKYGYISLKEILKDEFITYQTVSVEEVLRRLNREVEEKINIEKIIENIDTLNDEEIRVKEKIFEILQKDHELTFDSKKGIFRDNTKTVEPKALTIKDIVEIVNNNLPSKNLKIKHPKDLTIDKEGKYTLKKCYEQILEIAGINYNLNNKNPKYWLKSEEDFKPLTSVQQSTKIKKIFQKIYLLNSIEDIIDLEENEIKEAYIEQIENYGLEYDSFRSSFIDKLNPIIRKTLVCTPEKYFREAKSQSLILEDFEKENKELILEIKKLFGE